MVSTPEESAEQSFDQLSQQRKPGLVRELLSYLRDDRKWFLLPIIVGLLILGAIIVVSGTSIAPLIYTLF